MSSYQNFLLYQKAPDGATKSSKERPFSIGFSRRFFLMVSIGCQNPFVFKCLILSFNQCFRWAHVSQTVLSSFVGNLLPVHDKEPTINFTAVAIGFSSKVEITLSVPTSNSTKSTWEKQRYPCIFPGIYGSRSVQ